MSGAAATVLSARPHQGFVETPFVRDLASRAIAYLSAGFPVHFRGPSGSGKSTLAMHVAHRLGRPVMLICGDDEFGTSSLVGGESGYRRRRVIDNYVHSVLKTEEDFTQRWVDNRLTIAVREGLTLIYDEFTRSRPEANNVLLSVLEEKLLVLPTSRNGSSYIPVHPGFAAIFTSNPEDYAGVHKTQDALRDRMVTMDVDYFDRETEIAITQARANIDVQDAERVVSIVRRFRETGEPEFVPTVRSCIMIGKVLALRGIPADGRDPVFVQTCIDVLCSQSNRAGTGGRKVDKRRTVLLDLINRMCGSQSETA